MTIFTEGQTPTRLLVETAGMTPLIGGSGTDEAIWSNDFTNFIDFNDDAATR